MTEQKRSGPLAGLRVLDLTQMLAGPYCTMLLADLGATVLKVEALSGDLTRHQGPFVDTDQIKAYGGYFQSIHRNKLGIALNLKEARGREILLRLVKETDVLVENFRVGVMEHLGLAYETLRAIHPKLVYTCIRGFGDPRTGEGPYTNWPAFDIIAQAMGGLMGITGPDPEHPTKAGPGIGDIFPATLAAFGILAAVRHAEQSGQGQFVDVSMYDSMIALCERIIYQYSYTKQIPYPQGNTHPIFCPFDAFPTMDGWVTIAAPGDHHWRELCRAMGQPALGNDERFATNSLRIVHAQEVRSLVCTWTSSRTKQAVLERLGSVVPCAPVNTAQDIVHDPHVMARKMVVELEQPGSDTPIFIAGIPIKMTETPASVVHRAPLLG